MNNDTVRYNDVFKVLYKIRAPLSLREISKQVAAQLKIRHQDIEDNVARIVQSGVAIGLLVQVGDAYSYYSYAAAKPSQPEPQEPDVAVQAPDNDSSLPSSALSVSHSGSVPVEPRDDLAAVILAEHPSARRSRSTQRVGSYRSQQVAVAAAKSIAAAESSTAAKRQPSSTASQAAKRPAAETTRTLSLTRRDEEPCTSSCRPVVTRERIADLMASAGLDPRSRPFRVAETLLAEELNRDSGEDESGAENRRSDETNTGPDDDDEDDGDSDMMFDGVLYAGCGHTSTTNGADFGMLCPLETPEDCPACQRRKQAASRKRRQNAKKRNKSRSKSRSAKKRR